MTALLVLFLIHCVADNCKAAVLGPSPACFYDNGEVAIDISKGKDAAVSWMTRNAPTDRLDGFGCTADKGRDA